jgi:hypothetical protein
MSFPLGVVERMGLNDLSKDKLIDLARVLEHAEAYDDMCDVMTVVVEKTVAANEDLQVEDRNLLSVAFKNVVGARRTSLRAISSEPSTPLIEMYKTQLGAELKSTCMDILNLLGATDNKLIKTGERNEGQVFYLKMAADYYRYLSECLPNDDEKFDEKARQKYEDAFEIAKSVMGATHPIRLGLVLNYSVCLYEIIQDEKEACALAKTAFDSAIRHLDSLEEKDYKDSTLIMQLLRDNLTLWTSNDNCNDEDGAL